MIHNLQPGPLLYKNNPEIVNTIFATHLVAHLAMFALMTFGIAFFARLIQVPRAFVLPMVIVFSALGAFGLNNRAFDIWVMLGFGLLGVLLELAKVPLAPFVVGLVLAPVAEAELRSGLMASGGSFMPLIERPVACAMLILSAVLFAWPFIRSRRKEHYRERPGKRARTGRTWEENHDQDHPASCFGARRRGRRGSARQSRTEPRAILKSRCA